MGGCGFMGHQVVSKSSGSKGAKQSDNILTETGDGIALETGDGVIKTEEYG